MQGAVRVLLGVVFAVAGGLKLASPQRFADNMGEFGIVVDALLLPTAVALALLEVATGVGVLLRRRGAIWLAAALLGVFSCALIYGLGIGLDVDCGCLPLGVREPLSVALARDIVMLVAAGWLLATSRKEAKTR